LQIAAIGITYPFQPFQTAYHFFCTVAYNAVTDYGETAHPSVTGIPPENQPFKISRLHENPSSLYFVLQTQKAARLKIIRRICRTASCGFQSGKAPLRF